MLIELLITSPPYPKTTSQKHHRSPLIGKSLLRKKRTQNPKTTSPKHRGRNPRHHPLATPMGSGGLKSSVPS